MIQVSSPSASDFFNGLLESQGVFLILSLASGWQSEVFTKSLEL
jgi:hypothetical protein